MAYSEVVERIAYIKTYLKKWPDNYDKNLEFGNLEWRAHEILYVFYDFLSPLS